MAMDETRTITGSDAMNSDSNIEENSNSESFQYLPWLSGLWEKVGLEITKESMLLDFGCGVGECVDQLRSAGLSMLGCDIVFPESPDARLESYLRNGVIRNIETEPYKIPFDDNSFDFILSSQVFEHVMDYDATLSELRRITKPGGINIHVFPGRWRLVEPHVWIPLATFYRPYWWLYLWALLGIRNQYQQGYSPKTTADINYRYLKEETNYLTRRRISRFAGRHFEKFRFAEDIYFYPIHDKYFQRFPFLLGPYRKWFSDTEMRVLLLEG